jgi:hypothetical protein
LSENDKGTLPGDNDHPVFAEPGTTTSGGSNPTPRTYGSTPRSEVRHIQEIEPEVLSHILQFAFWMQRTGYRNSTVKTCIRTLKGLARRTNLLDPESVKSHLASAQLSENRKTKVLEDVSRFYAFLKIPFERPRYKRIETLPFIPLESEVDQLIAGVGQKSAAARGGNARRSVGGCRNSSRCRDIDWCLSDIGTQTSSAAPAEGDFG